MEPMYLRDVEANSPAGSAYAELIAKCRQAGSLYPQIWCLFGFKPNATRHLERFTHEVLRGPSPLSPGFRELIATLTSAHNRCQFCHKSHAAAAAYLLKDEVLVNAVVDDLDSSPLTEPEKSLLRFTVKVTHDSASIGSGDIDVLCSHGWSDEAIYDAITVAALFNFFNRWVHAAGVHVMPEEAHRAAAPRMANGYIRPAEQA